MSDSSHQDPERLLDGLNTSQAEAVRFISGRLAIRAAAGTGKTTTVSRRIAFGIETGQFRSNRVLALTFTNRAAAELRTRLRELGHGRVSVRTMHSAALAQIHFFWQQFHNKPLPQLLADKSDLLAQIGKRVMDRELRFGELQAISAELEWCKYSLNGVANWKQQARSAPHGISQTDLQAVLDEYEARKIELNQIDWEDVLVLCLGLMLEEPRALDEVRQQYRHFTVDEYQDFSPLQQQLLEIWSGDRADLCVVGDERQAIFGFSGSSADYLVNFLKRNPGAVELELDENYRSGQPIVRFANTILDRKPMSTSRLGQLEPLHVVTANADQEAFKVSQAIRADIEAGHEAESIAVLARTNLQLRDLTESLKKVGVPHQLNAGTGYWKYPEVKRCVLMLRALQGQTDLEPLFVELHKILVGLGWTPSRPELEVEKWERLNWFNEILDDLSETTAISDYLREIDERQQANQEPIRPAVTLSTIHAAKGLQWERVYLIGVSEGKFPHPQAKSEEARAEEFRLLYVAATRARDFLAIYSPGPAPAEFSAILSRIGRHDRG